MEIEELTQNDILLLKLNNKPYRYLLEKRNEWLKNNRKIEKINIDIEQRKQLKLYKKPVGEVLQKRSVGFLQHIVYITNNGLEESFWVK
jgi:hypothetical protein